MNNFEHTITTISDEQLIDMYKRVQKYQPELVVAIETELNNRNIAITDISNSEYNQEVANNVINHPPDTRRITGWLVFFLFVVGLSGLLTTIFGLAALSIHNYDVGLGFTIALLGYMSELILYLGIGTLAGYTIISFINLKPNAVALGKIYLILIFSFNLLAIISNSYEPNDWASKTFSIRSLTPGIMWFIYLCQSKQVNELFPKETRKIFKFDKYLLAIITLPPILWLLFILFIGYGLSLIFN